MAEIFTRQYETASGLVEVIITYDRTYTPYFLDFDVVEDIELSYGYEDEDQLTFYPNVVRVVFDDFKKQNYDVLKLSVGAYANTLPENKMSFGGLEIKLNGSRKFKGYIDELSLEYDEEKLQTSFEALCLSHQLKNMNVDRDKIIGYDNNRLPDNQIEIVPVSWYGVYKQIWPEFGSNNYDASQISIPGLYGTFFKHDWVFNGDDVVQTTCDGQKHLTATRSWANLNHVNTQIGFRVDSMPFGPNRPYRTWADYLKILALQFGATIGVMDYGKVYFTKRFGHVNLNPTDVSNKVIGNYFSKSIYLPVLRGVEVTNHWNGERTFSYGEIERTSNGEYKYEDKIKSFDTYVGSYIQNNGSGTTIYVVSDLYVPCNNYYLLGVWNVKDLQLNTDGQLFELVAKWQRDNRMVPKDKVECKLYGIDYDMVSIYKITPPYTGLSVNFRPMTMKKSLMNNETEISGIEV
jgi:hypothetical protein